MKKNVLLLIGTIIILFVLSEIAARLWVHFNPPRKYTDTGAYSYFPFMPYSPTPNFIDKDSIRVLNSRGFRNSYEIKVPKDANTIRIICLGGSSTYDDYGGQKNEYIWTGRLEDYLNKNSFTGKKYEVINCSAHNYTTYMNLIDYMTRCRDLQPDMVIVYEGVNEIYFNGFDNVSFAHTNVFQPFDFDYHKYYYITNHNPLIKYSAFFKLLYIRLFINPLNLNLMSVKSVHHFELDNLKNSVSDSLTTFKKGLESFIAFSKIDNFKLVFLSQAYNFKNLNRYFEQDNKENMQERLVIFINEAKRISDIMSNTALQNNIPFLNMHELLNQDDRLFSSTTDFVHFSKEGSDFFGNKVFSFLKEQNLTE